MSLPNPSDTKFSYAHYLTWTDDERIELINGVPYDMTPAPSPKHQDILLNLGSQFRAYLEGKSCRAFIAPFDVRLFSEDRSDDEIHNVIQPDLTVICDLSKIDDRGLRGSPDLVIEILSKSTAKKDKTIKKELYEKAKVKEYWIVDPFSEYVEVYILHENNMYDQSTIYGNDDTVKISLFDDFEIELATVFTD